MACTFSYVCSEDHGVLGGRWHQPFFSMLTENVLCLVLVSFGCSSLILKQENQRSTAL